MQKRSLAILISLLAIGSLLYALKSVYYEINPTGCWACGRCVSACTTGAIQYNDNSGVFYIIPELCNGCGLCVENCPHRAIHSVTGNSDDVLPHPELILKNNPNPINNYTDFCYSLPKNANQAELFVANSKGQIVFKRNLSKRTASIRWNGRGNHGTILPEGVYLATLLCGTAKTTKKITLVH